MNIVRDKVLDLINSNKGKIFKTIFIKNNGDLREMICRTKVKIGVTGKGMSYDAKSRGLLPVYDMKNKAFKMVNINTMKSINIGGLKYEVQK